MKVYEVGGSVVAETCCTSLPADPWRDFARHEGLACDQLALFQKYYELLTSWNERMNLTTITSRPDVIAYHFQDSLALGHACDLTRVNTIVDVGSGAGFPGIPLKIRYPHLEVILIEVRRKRRTFLSAAVHHLELEKISIVEVDWLTFLNTDKRRVDIFCARASLQPELLMQAHERSCTHRNADIVYWAAETWKPGPKMQGLVDFDYEYRAGDKVRRLIFFKGTTSKARHRGSSS